MTLRAASFAVGVSSLAPAHVGRSHHLGVVRVKVEPSDRSVESMRKFSEQYARRSGTHFCVDKGVTSLVIKAHSA